MQLLYNPWIIPYGISIIIGASLALYARRRPSPAAKIFTLLMITVILWTFCYVMELSSASAATKTLWVTLKFIASIPSPAIWLIFSLVMTHHEERFGTIARLILIPWVIVTWVVIATNDLHHWWMD